MKNPILYRKRIIPNECILLKDDIILYCSDSIIITKWDAFHPTPKLHHGFSCYYLDKGYKISKFCREDNSLLYWYCDIIEPHYNALDNTLVVTDLLADVIVYPNGTVKIVDLDELAMVLETGALSKEQVQKALLQLNNLLVKIDNNEFDLLKSQILKYES